MTPPMNGKVNADLDLTMSRIIKAPRAVVWKAWSDPARFAQWWLPAPYTCRVVEMTLSPGGAFITEMSEDGRTFTPHLNACFLAVDEGARIVFTNLMSGGWRPTENTYPAALTAMISLRDHGKDTEYAAHVMHKNGADRTIHEELGFHDGWGTVAAQLARLVE